MQQDEPRHPFRVAVFAAEEFPAHVVNANGFVCAGETRDERAVPRRGRREADGGVDYDGVAVILIGRAEDTKAIAVVEGVARDLLVDC